MPFMTYKEDTSRILFPVRKSLLMPKAHDHVGYDCLPWPANEMFAYPFSLCPVAEPFFPVAELVEVTVLNGSSSVVAVTSTGSVTGDSKAQ